MTAATPNGVEITELHNRVPIILEPNQYGAWLNPDTRVDDAREALSHHRADELTAYRVGREVNNNTAKGRELIEPV